MISDLVGTGVWESCILGLLGLGSSAWVPRSVAWFTLRGGLLKSHEPRDNLVRVGATADASVANGG
jgi:hypothetical protein